MQAFSKYEWNKNYIKTILFINRKLVKIISCINNDADNNKAHHKNGCDTTENHKYLDHKRNNNLNGLDQ